MKVEQPGPDKFTELADVPNSYALNSSKFSTVTDYNPFIITISKTGYETYTSKLTLADKIDETITLKTVVKTRRSIDGKFYKALSPETGSDAKLLEI